MKLKATSNNPDTSTNTFDVKYIHNSLRAFLIIKRFGTRYRTTKEYFHTKERAVAYLSEHKDILKGYEVVEIDIIFNDKIK